MIYLCRGKINMKKIFGNSNNLLFIAAAVLFLQFLIAVSCFFIQSVYYDFSSWTSAVYFAYCAAVCIVSGIIIFKKSGHIVSMWFAGIFLYFFAELMFVVKVWYISLSEFSFFADTIYNLWDNQPLYRLFISVSSVFVIYCALNFFTAEGKRFYIAAAGVNAAAFALIFFFMPGSEYLLIETEASVFEVAYIELIREAGLLVYMLNLFAFGLYKLYDER